MEKPLDIQEIFDVSKKMPPVICVEMSGNHMGSIETALRFVEEAKCKGADVVKVQVYRPDTITLRSNLPDFKLDQNSDWARHLTLFDLYQKAHTPWNWVERMFERATQINLPIFASPFDSSSVSFLEGLGCPMYKIASPEITDHGLIEACAKTKKPVILSTGLASRCDLDSAMSVLAKYSSPKMVLKCVSAYPTVLEDMNVSSIPWLANLYNIAAGLSDHSLGSEAAVAATALGARLIEKHFRLADDDLSVDSHFSMSLDQLPRFKKTVNEVYAAIGEPTLELPDSAKRLLSGRRSLYVVQDIKQGEKFTHKNIRSIRPSYGMPPKFLPQVIGLTASRGLEAGERLTAEKISNWSISHD